MSIAAQQEVWRQGSGRTEWPVLLLPLLALLVVVPLLRHGPSCGHDFGFHMQSWMDASAQMRHGNLLPRWAYSPAFNAGEPRFVFYPPLSWLLGSVLLLLVPASVVPALFTWLALTLAGAGLYALARRFASPGDAVLAATLYLVNPYLLFTAFERTAYAELLAAAWLPWLLRAALAEDPPVLSVAVPIALLWLTNAPAAVMGTYTLCFVVALRLGITWWAGRRQRPETIPPTLAPLLRGSVAGLVLGLMLAGFYLVPAAWERRYVQIAMAIIPNMRVEDNFLFGHTGYGPHDAVLHTASLVALGLLVLTGAALLTAFLAKARLRAEDGSSRAHGELGVLLALTVVIGALLTPVTLPLWHHVPELAFLQFPWRWMAVLGCCFGAACALALGRARLPLSLAIATSLLLAGLCGSWAMLPFREGCEAHELPQQRVALFAAHHGVGPTDEYTPGNADNDQLRWDDPAWWLAIDVNAPGPGTVPNPASTIVDYDQPPPLEQTISGSAPMVLHVNVSHPEDLILNLRDYPAWAVLLNGQPSVHLERDDGLLALALPVGANEITIHWQRLPDVWLGDALSLLATAIAASLLLQSRKIKS